MFSLATTSLSNLNPSSRVWIYASVQPFSVIQKQELEQELDLFLTEWNAHGSKLTAGYTIKENQFIIVAADESNVQASGCSIDKSVRVIKAFEEKHKLGLLERGLVFYKKDNVIKSVDFRQVEPLITSDELDESTIVFDNTLTNLADLQTRWQIELKNTWLSRYLQKV